MPAVTILNGPGLDCDLTAVEAMCRAAAAELGLMADFRQSSYEGDLIDWITQEGAAVDAGHSIGAVFNPGAFTTTSVALHDAIVDVCLPVVEVLFSTGGASRVSPAARGLVAGFGVHGYVLAIRALRELSLWGGDR